MGEAFILFAVFMLFILLIGLNIVGDAFILFATFTIFILLVRLNIVLVMRLFCLRSLRHLFCLLD